MSTTTAYRIRGRKVHKTQVYLTKEDALRDLDATEGWFFTASKHMVSGVYRVLRYNEGGYRKFRTLDLPVAGAQHVFNEPEWLKETGFRATREEALRDFRKARALVIEQVRKETRAVINHLRTAPINSPRKARP